MKEEFLQFIWEHHLFTSDQLQTVDGRPLQILSTGRPNFDSGPDFFNARIKIGETTWAGNIEIHQKSSHWMLHKHDEDEAYSNVILHVVEHFDKPVIVNQQELPTLELKYRSEILENFEQLLKSKKWIACEEKLPNVDAFILRFWYSSLMIERLQSKTEAILEILQQNTNNWNETFYQLLARNFGMKINSLPFELLARSLPLQILAKHKNSLLQIEALLFGSSGLLNEVLLGDDYFLSLRNEYSFLYKKYNLSGVDAHLWKFMRLRPVNFPTIRIAQLASLIHQSSALFSRILEIEDLEELRELFNITASEYWNTHYQFNKTSRENKPKHIGDSFFQNLVINTISPLLFVYGDQHLSQAMKDRALNFLEKLSPESNQITDKWAELGIDSRSAFESQALIHLKKQYCENKKCLHCQIGAKIITSVKQSNDEPALQ
ncbi:MAG TPA: DUF2851 family protein [Prolixibacteraceae bacterium]|nr:DUF2851 family protein [Prolixibacteraceae bacterium]HPR85498.1 DUF2851 family protein [Prolixibacteraceae bacterium]